VIQKKDIVVWNSYGPCDGMDKKNVFNRICSELIYEQFVISLEPDMFLITNMFEGHLYCNDSITTINLLKGKIPTSVILYDVIPLK